METHTVRFEHDRSPEILSPPFSVRLPPGMTLDMLVDVLSRACWDELKMDPVLADPGHGWPLLIRSAIRSYLGAAVTDVHEEPGGGLVYVLGGAGAGPHQVGAGIAYNIARVVLNGDRWEARGEFLAAELPWILAAVMARYAEDEIRAGA